MTTGPWRDLDRPPLLEAGLRRGLLRPGGFWGELRVLQRTGSTNQDVAAAARSGAAEGLLIAADEQTAGKGRRDRAWVAPPRAGLAFSMLFRPGEQGGASGARPVPPRAWGWLPLLVGVSVARAVHRLARVPALVKWPNDLLIGAHARKAAGVLAETVDRAVVVGVGLNVSTRREELPRIDATSLALEDAACTDRDPLLRALVRAIAEDYLMWREHGGDAASSGLRSAYRDSSATLGREVRVHLAGGEQLAGIASDVDEFGRLLVSPPAGGTVAVAAGDVVHVR